MLPLDRRRALRAGLAALSSQALVASRSSAAQLTAPSLDAELANHLGWISVFDSRFAGGAKGDGVTDDTMAITAAAVAAAESGRVLHMAGTFAVANLKLPGGGGSLHIFGDPTFIQARPNTLCLLIEDKLLQQRTGCRMTCTFVPHPGSSKTNANNVALNLTGFSSSNVEVVLGKASTHSDVLGRFHTLIYADAASPFHYGNRIRVIASAVPAPRFCVRYGNRGRGAIANPNINTVSGWFYALDTTQGDILIDVADTTQTIVEGPTLIEQCPSAIGIRAGNFTTVRDTWFEEVGVALDFTSTKDTTANNCRIERCYFSGAGHVALLPSDMAAPPNFVECVGDFALTFRDQAGTRNVGPLRSRSHAQPSAPSFLLVRGAATIVPDQANLHRRVDHHGRTTYQLRFFLKPTSVDHATLRLVPPEGYAIEQAIIGVRDAAGRSLPWGLGDNVAGTDFNWTWESTDVHVLNMRVTLFANG
jgi:hypothetical protein